MLSDMEGDFTLTPRPTLPLLLISLGAVLLWLPLAIITVLVEQFSGPIAGDWIVNSPAFLIFDGVNMLLCLAGVICGAIAVFRVWDGYRLSAALVTSIILGAIAGLLLWATVEATLPLLGRIHLG